MVEIVELDNGVRIIYEHMNEVKSVAMGAFIKVGSRYEALEWEGASHFVEHMLFKGTDRFNAQELVEAFENLGGQLNAFTTREYTCVYGRTLDEDVLKGLDIILDMLFVSQFAEQEFNLEKKVILEEIKMYEDTPDELIHDVFNQHFFTGHRLGHSILGTVDTITQITRDDLYQYYQDFYQPQNMVIALAGRFDIKPIQDYLQEYFKDKANQGAVNALPEHFTYSPFNKAVSKQVEQVQICVGVPGMSYFDSRRSAFSLLNSMLGGGMSARLFQSLREKRGLAYSVYSYGSAYADAGLYSIYAGVSSERVGEFFAALKEELTDFVEQGIRERELARAKQMFKASLYMGMESVSSRMNRIGKRLLLQNDYYAPETLVKEAYAVNSDDVQDLSRSLLQTSPVSLAAIANPNVLDKVQREFSRYFAQS